MRLPRTWVLGLGVLGAGLLVASCQAVFTWSPFRFLQRAPENLPPEQQIEYAQAALSSGDPNAVAAALEAISAAARDPANQGNAELQYTAAQLALEVAGAGDLLEQVLTQGGDFTVDETIWTSVDASLVGDAGVYLQNANTAGADLTATDCFVAAVGLMVAGADEGTDVLDTAATNPNKDDAVAFLEQGIAELPADDPAASMLEGILDTINGL